MERGREQPPGSAPTAVPGPARRVAHAPVSVTRTAAKTVGDLRAACERVSCCTLVAVRALNALHFDTDSEARTRLHRPSHDQRRAVLGLVKARRFAPPRLRGPAGLDDACAQLEGSTYVMAEEPRRIVSY